MKKTILKFFALVAFATLMMINIQILSPKSEGEISLNYLANIAHAQNEGGWDWDGNDDDDCDNWLWDCSSLYVIKDVPCDGNSGSQTCGYAWVNGIYIYRCEQKQSNYSGWRTQCLSHGPDFCAEDPDC